MSRFFAGSLPPGPAGDIILQLLAKNDVNYRFSERIDEVIEYLENLKDSTNFDTMEGFGFEYTGNGRLEAGHNDSVFQFNLIRQNPLRVQGPSALHRNESGGASIGNLENQNQERPALNAIDILIGATPGNGSNVKKEESDEGETPLFFQTAQPLFSLRQEGNALVKEDEPGEGGRQETGVVEGLVKEEDINEMVGESGGHDVEVGEKDTEETYQNFAGPSRAIQSMKQPQFNCHICKTYFPEANSLISHMYIHSRCNSYQCHICQKVYRHLTQLKDHVRLHTGDRPFRCNKCCQSFSSQRQLRAHEERFHSTMKSFQCDICRERFAFEKTLHVHMETHEIKKVECKMCHKKFAHLSALGAHCREMHRLRP